MEQSKIIDMSETYQLSLPLSDKVKQLHGDCISYNKATTIWLLPVADNSVTRHDVIYIIVWDDHVFKSYQEPAEALWLSLYCIRCKHHIIALLYRYAIAIGVEAIVGETTMTLRWRSRCRASDDGYHDDALEMEIKSTRWWWPYHVTYFD